jgi:hypothetical protein
MAMLPLGSAHQAAREGCVVHHWIGDVVHLWCGELQDSKIWYTMVPCGFKEPPQNQMSGRVVLIIYPTPHEQRVVSCASVIVPHLAFGIWHCLGQITGS